MRVHELQVEKMDTMIEMLSNYRKDTSFIITKMNLCFQKQRLLLPFTASLLKGL